MAFWPWEKEPQDSPITELDKTPGSPICLKCGETPRELLDIDGLFYCEPCYEAKERRERFEREEEEWNKPNPQEG